MKKIYSKPFMTKETFSANEYVAGCDKYTQELWRVKVDDLNNLGPEADLTTGGELWYESNGIAGLQKSGSNADTIVHGKQLSVPSNYIHDGYVYFDNPGKMGYFTNNYDITIECLIMGEALMYGNWGDPNNLWHTGSHAYYAASAEKVVSANAS